jgi:hypothetical protein
VTIGSEAAAATRFTAPTLVLAGRVDHRDVGPLRIAGEILVAAGGRRDADPAVGCEEAR